MDCRSCKAVFRRISAGVENGSCGDGDPAFQPGCLRDHERSCLVSVGRCYLRDGGADGAENEATERRRQTPGRRRSFVSDRYGRSARGSAGACRKSQSHPRGYFCGSRGTDEERAIPKRTDNQCFSRYQNSADIHNQLRGFSEKRRYR